jgi:plastocyanin
MAIRHTTARGKTIDMTKLKMQNQYKPTLGNSNRNVRGDIITKKGVVLKTQEQIQEERAAMKRQQDTVNKRADIKGNALLPDSITKKPGRPVKQVNVADQHFEEAPILTADHVSAPITEKPTVARRKIVESDK